MSMRHSSAEDSTGMGFYETDETESNSNSSEGEENGEDEESISNTSSSHDMTGPEHECDNREVCSSTQKFNSYDEERDKDSELAPLKHRLVSVCTIGKD